MNDTLKILDDLDAKYTKSSNERGGKEQTFKFINALCGQYPAIADTLRRALAVVEEVIDIKDAHADSPFDDFWKSRCNAILKKRGFEGESK